jgi:hypothetical protein
VVWVSARFVFAVSARLRLLISAIFQPEPVNWRLFFGFGPFTGSVRDALSAMADYPRRA